MHLLSMVFFCQQPDMGGYRLERVGMDWPGVDTIILITRIYVLIVKDF